jgi:tRNA threonylcarbamoyl adenosine modification protein (Sua5/YciO/YrdC/YwlC family)
MIDKSTKLLKIGKVVVFPTETVYGLGCDALNYQAVQRIYGIKKRNKKKHLPLMFSDFKSLSRFVDLTAFQESIIKKFSPGPITYIVNRKRNIKLKLFFPEKIAVRIPNCKTTLRMLNGLKSPIVATSLNIANKKEITNFTQINKYIRNKVDHIICNNSEVNGISSTIIDISDDKIKLVRSGILNYNSLLTK